MSKIILSFETSSSICGVSVMDNGNLLSLVEENSYRKHNENIADFTDRAIKQSKKLISELHIKNNKRLTLLILSIIINIGLLIIFTPFNLSKK